MPRKYVRKVAPATKSVEPKTALPDNKSKIGKQHVITEQKQFKNGTSSATQKNTKQKNINMLSNIDLAYSDGYKAGKYNIYVENPYALKSQRLLHSSFEDGVQNYIYDNASNLRHDFFNKEKAKARQAKKAQTLPKTNLVTLTTSQAQAKPVRQRKVYRGMNAAIFEEGRADALSGKEAKSNSSPVYLEGWENGKAEARQTTSYVPTI